MNGHGTYTWPDGRRYEGDYLMDKKHGKGKYTWASGKWYDGSWNEGQQHGDGVFSNPETGDTKRGRWENGKRAEWYQD